jgi:hypothetical protein
VFDTGQAARVMELGGYGLAHLLRHYCGINVDKKYQLADWRARPLSAEMLLYARQDTHYLLYVYDRLRNEALARGARPALPVGRVNAAANANAAASVSTSSQSKAKSKKKSTAASPSSATAAVNTHTLRLIYDRSRDVCAQVYRKP